VALLSQIEPYYDTYTIKHLLKLLLLPVETFTIFFVKMLVKCIMEKESL